MSVSVLDLISKAGGKVRLQDGWELPVLFLDDLVLRRQDLFKAPRRNKDDPRNQRYVYRDVRQDVYLKVWVPEYARAPNFVDALRAGFYDSRLCPLLSGIIVNAEFECRGYRMDGGNLFKRSIPESLFRQLLTNSIKTNRFYYDLVRCCVELGGSYSMIDLEGVYRFEQMAHYMWAKVMGKRARGCVACPISYHRMLYRLRQRMNRSINTGGLDDYIDGWMNHLTFVVKNI